MNREKELKQTELGQRLRQIRTKIVASGKTLLDKEEIEQEVRPSNRQRLKSLPNM